MGDPRQGRSWDLWGRALGARPGFFRTSTGRLAFLVEPTSRVRCRLVGDTRLEWFGEAPSEALEETIHLGWRNGPRYHSLGYMRFAEEIGGHRPGLAFTLDRPVSPETRALLTPVLTRSGGAAIDPATLLAPADDAPADDAPADDADYAEILLRHLLSRYFGADPTRTHALGDAAIPATLRLVHGVLRNPLPWHKLRPLADLRAVDGRVVFVTCERPAARWAWEGTGTDPAVVVSRDETWQPEAPHISTFLAQLFIQGAARVASHGGRTDTLDRRSRTHLLRHFTELPGGPWASTGARFYAGPGRVAVVTPRGPRTWAAEVGAEEPFDLHPLDRLLKDWPRYR